MGFLFGSRKASDLLSRSLHERGFLFKRSFSDKLSKSFHGGGDVFRRESTTSESLFDVDGTVSSRGTAAPVYLKSCLKKRKSLSGLDLEVSSSPATENRDSAIYKSQLSTSRKTCSKRILFNVVQVREYVPDLSHNPTVKDGIAVGLGWLYIEKDTLKIDEYERMQPPRVKCDTELLLNYADKLRILRAGGFDMNSVKKAMLITKKARNLRAQTLKKLRAEDKEFVEQMKKLERGKRQQKLNSTKESTKR